MFSVKTRVHSPTWKLKHHKCIHKCSKKETHHESDDLNRINSREFTFLPLFALQVTHKEKTSVLHAGQFEKDRIPASRCSSRKFLSHLPPGSNRAGGKLQSKKLYRLKRKLLHLQLGNKVHAFPEGISPKMNALVWLEFKLAYYNILVQYFCFVDSTCNIYDLPTIIWSKIILPF